MFALLFGTFALFAVILFTFGFYLFSAYVLFRIGEKFRVGSYPAFLVPVYNVMLLCDCAGITRWTAAGIVMPGLAAALLGIFIPLGDAGYAALAIFTFSWIYLWGSVAERLGKNFWLWGLLTAFLGGIPILFLAFDSSLPSRGRRQ